MTDDSPHTAPPSTPGCTSGRCPFTLRAMLSIHQLPASVHLTKLPFRGVVLLAILGLFALSALRYAAKIEKPSSLGTQTRSAVLRWRPQVLALDSGTDIYRTHAYPNPPIMALILRPLYAFTPTTGGLIWFALKAAMGLFILYSALRLVGPLPPWAALVGILLGLHPILGDLSHGNVNLFIGFLVVAAWELLRRRFCFSAGIILALAIACKITPALFVPYLVWKRSWRALGGVLVGLALWWAVVPGAILGFGFNTQLLESWFDVMVRPFVLEGKVTSEHANQSLPGLFFRLLTAEPSFIDYSEDDRPIAAGFHNLATLSAGTAKRLVQVGMGIFAVVIALQARARLAARPGSAEGLALAAEFAFILLGMLLFSERTWKHHAVLLVIPMLVLTTATETRPGWRRPGLVLLGLLGLLQWVPSALPETGQDLCLVYGSTTMVYLVLVGTMGLLMRVVPTPVAVGQFLISHCQVSTDWVNGGDPIPWSLRFP
ncbi:MAG: glycosyltransferase family 87 protein [Gemmataceae bacterium]